jgi:hypothetical protein
MGNPFASPTLEAPPAAPATDPSPTDELVQRAKDAAARRAQPGSSLSSTFLTGPLGDPTAAPTTAPTLKGR